MLVQCPACVSFASFIFFSITEQVHPCDERGSQAQTGVQSYRDVRRTLQFNGPPHRCQVRRRKALQAGLTTDTEDSRANRFISSLSGNSLWRVSARFHSLTCATHIGFSNKVVRDMTFTEIYFLWHLTTWEK